MDIKNELEDLKKITEIINNLNDVDNMSDSLDYTETLKELTKRYQQ